MTWGDTHDHYGYASDRDVSDLRSQLDTARYDAERALDDLRGDLHHRISGLRDDLHASIDGLWAAIRQLEERLPEPPADTEGPG